mmetsp:Transcript_117484/g.312517  ORF Transcript_117484/g.312517 Transcript_117484/m.312517 type:complete len:312 (-) Transcript_117484:106-1041(-)
MVDFLDGLPELLGGEGTPQCQGHKHHLNRQEKHGPVAALHRLPLEDVKAGGLETAVAVLQDARADVLKQELLVCHHNQYHLDGDELAGGVPSVQEVVGRPVGNEEAVEAEQARSQEGHLHVPERPCEPIQLESRKEDHTEDAHRGREQDELPHEQEHRGEAAHREVVLRKARPEAAAQRRCAPMRPGALHGQRTHHNLGLRLLTAGCQGGLALSPEQEEEKHAKRGQRQGLVKLLKRGTEQNGRGAPQCQVGCSGKDYGGIGDPHVVRPPHADRLRQQLTPVNQDHGDCQEEADATAAERDFQLGRLQVPT